MQGQYADPADAAPLYELYLVNTGAVARTFTEVDLDGRRLTRPPAALLGPGVVSLEGRQVRLPAAPEDPDLFWWQFYPSATLPPGGSAVLQLCFRGDVRTPRTLAVRDAGAGGDLTTHAIPRRSAQPVPRISAVSAALDLSRLYVLCDAPGNPPTAVWLGGRPLPLPRPLAAHDPRHGTLLELRPPFPLADGMPLDLRLRFADGRERRALVRLLRGIVLDAPGDLGRASRELSLSPDPGALLIPIDAVCSDLEEGRPGAAAWSVIQERERAWRRRPGLLAGFGFCTAVTPLTSAIYGRMADAVYAKPYRLGWGANPARFLDEELDTLAAQRAAAAPRPFLYIPERFARHGRHLSPAELDLLEWSALALGAKGVRLHFGLNPGGLDATPDLLPALRRTGAEIRRLEPLLAPLVPAGDETQGDETTGYVRLLTAWSGSQGLLCLVRDRNAGAIPGAPTARRNVPVSLDVPPWCRGTQLLDLLTGERLAPARPGRLTVTLPELRGFRLLWIDADPARPALKPLTRKGAAR